MSPRLTAVALLLFAAPLAAQVPTATLAPRPAPTSMLTLEEALRQARLNSPTYRQAVNQEDPARVNVRAAYGQLAPTFSASLGGGYTGSGESQFGAFFNRTSPFISSNFGLFLNWQLDGRVFSAPKQQKALQRATTEDVANAGNGLRADVTTQYLVALQQTAQVEVARVQVARNTDFLALAQARYQVGQANLLDVRQAEVTKGNSEVQLLQALQLENEAKLELFRRMGITPPGPVDGVALPDSFPVSQPAFQLEELVKTALDQNPSIKALRARDDAARAGVSAAKSEYFPRLQAQAGWSGFTQQFTDKSVLLGQELQAQQGDFAQCPFTNNLINAGFAPGPLQDCSPSAYFLQTGGAALTPERAQQLLDQNSTFPFNFKKQPFQLTVTLSLPIWDGWSRSSRISRAKADQKNATEQTRAQELQTRATVTSRWLAVRTSYETILVQARNREAARDQLKLAQDRYRIGSGTSLELSDAQNSVAGAEGNYVNAVYNYHIAITALEGAVGRPLR